MGDVLFLVLRRLRVPLITLLVVYAVSVAGLVAIPGVDGDGRPWRMGYFHALYVMSYTATTIGFGEIPYPFTDAQRLWVTVAIYLSVIGWAYTLGSVFALSQDPTFRAAASRSLFLRRVARLREPYCVICGYGRSGTEIARALDDLRVRLVIVESDPTRVASIAVQPFSVAPLVLVADARRPEVLRDAGIAKAECRAVLAMTGDDEANQTIAIGTRVLDPNTQVIARVVDPVMHANLAEFGGVHVINPFHTFALNVGLDFAAPAVLQLEEWLTCAPGADRPEPLRLPRGHWVLAGYGRFGRPLAAALGASGQSWQAFDPHFVPPDEAEDRVHARGGTEDGLRAAGIERAVGVIAGTDSDTVNLAVVKMARRANPAAAVIVRRNKAYNQALIEAAEPTLTFVQSDLMLHEVLQSLTTPLLERFLELARRDGGVLAREACDRLDAAFGARVPGVWTFDCDPAQPGIRQALSEGGTPLRVGELLLDPRDPAVRLAAVPLMLSRAAPSGRPTDTGRPQRWLPPGSRARAVEAPGAGVLDRAGTGLPESGRGASIALPPESTVLAPGDRVLFAGAPGVEALQRRFLLDPSPIEFVRTGVEPARGWLFRRLAARARPRT
ncbi:MAG: potassium transporter TrkA [Burkholderiales bacterium]|nr:MAG: potassium transporter TrkA [Burkholderiales bacterium]